MTRRRIFHRLGTAVLFLVLACLWTWPLVTVLGSAVRDHGDPLLNTWILQWNVETWRSGDWAGYFDPPMFYPYARTLAYSEHLFTQGMLAALLSLGTNNGILIYNVVLLAGIASAGWGAYLLAEGLTGSWLGGLVAGSIYAFAAFPFAQLSHLQAQWAGGIPVALLLMFRYLSTRRLGYLVGFVPIFVLQSLANGHYALYLALLVVAVVAAMMSAEQRWREATTWRALVVGGLVSGAALAPFFYQYWALRREMGFVRQIEYWARPSSFLTTMPLNNVWGNLLSDGIRSTEDALYPGIAATVLALIGFLATRRGARAELATAASAPRPPVDLSPPSRVSPLAVGVGLCLLVALYALASGRHSAWAANGPLLLAGALLLRLRAKRRQVTVERGDTPVRLSEDAKVVWFSAAALVLSLLFTFGPLGPYVWLHAHVPGFDGLRVATRFITVALLMLGVLAAFGVRAIARRASGASKFALLLLPLLVWMEQGHLPVAWVKVPSAAELPPVYRWLTQQPATAAIAEIPFGERNHAAETEGLRVYWQTYHWRPTVNGHSGYLSPLYYRIADTWKAVMPADTLQPLAKVGTRFVIVHLDELDPDRRRIWQAQLENGAGGLGKVVARFPGVLVFELRARQ